MSLLEDVFLEDETEEAHQLERVIEGDEFEERRDDSDDNSEKDDEAVEDKRRIEPESKQQRVVKNPRFVLNPARLTGPRGIQIIPEHFKDFKLKGKGHEKEDLDLVLKKLEHWAYRLYPKFKFEDCLKKIETLGKKRPVMVHLHKIRNDQYQTEDTVVQKDSSDDEATPAAPPEEDEFDKLLQQQIEIARSTPGPNSAKKPGFSTPVAKRLAVGDVGTPFTMPKGTSSPSISDEQKERMIRNRKMAEERRLARLKQNNSTENAHNAIQTIEEDKENSIDNSLTVDSTEMVPANDSNVRKRNNKSNVIDSSDDDDEHLESSTVLSYENGVNDADADMREETNINSKKGTRKHKKSNVIDSSDDDDADTSQNLDNFEKSKGNKEIVDLTHISVNNSAKATAPTPSSDFDKIVDLTEGSVNANTEAMNNLPKNVSNYNNSDSSDEECDVTSVNQSVVVDIHKSINNDDKDTDKADRETSKDISGAALEVDIIEETKLVEDTEKCVEANENGQPEVSNPDDKLITETDVAISNDLMDVDFSEEF
ncbi:unnamed protein product [Plutella xylostella]|uniref:TIMELESS-interacting protein n=1 Tax=Plutella xylostella TaxID=51655 RepID=A0A8S4G5A5_PLUXY|nr:unnamed protein product [Plutella xylostella]